VRVTDPRLDFMNQCADIAGAALGEGAFAPGPAIWVGKREIAHFDSAYEVDIRLTKDAIRKRRPALKNDKRVDLRPGTSEWIRVRVTSASEIEHALGLVRDAVIANLPTAPPGPPPKGVDLDRRRRWH
jgi:hypothetical protein